MRDADVPARSPEHPVAASTMTAKAIMKRKAM
jgi:hypothetical protein